MFHPTFKTLLHHHQYYIPSQKPKLHSTISVWPLFLLKGNIGDKRRILEKMVVVLQQLRAKPKLMTMAELERLCPLRERMNIFHPTFMSELYLH